MASKNVKTPDMHTVPPRGRARLHWLLVDVHQWFIRIPVEEEGKEEGEEEGDTLIDVSYTRYTQPYYSLHTAYTYTYTYTRMTPNNTST